MSGNNFTRKYTISKQSGPVYINSYALNGIGVRYRNPTIGLDPISLPTGWTLPRIEDSYRIDFSQEYAVLEQAKARRQAIVGEAPDPNNSLRASQINPASLAGGIPLIPYQSSNILTPIPVSNDIITTTAETSTTTDTTVTKPLGEMSLRDFEGDSNDPFESTALQAIDVFSELQSVLQPELNNTATQQDRQTLPNSSNHCSNSPNNLSTTPPYSFTPQTVAMQPPVYSSSVPMGSGNIPQPRSNVRPPPGGVGVLVDFGMNAKNTPPIVKPSSSTQHGHSLVSPPNRPTPPPVRPKPVTRFPPVSIATHPSRSHYQGVQVVPPNNPEPCPPPYTEPYLPFYGEEEQLYTTTNSTGIGSHYDPVPIPQFQLPDITNSLSNNEKEAMSSISGMGFPSPRVARSLKQFDGDNQAVLDFLFLVGELEEKGYNGDSAEIALLTHDKDMTKSVDYLKQVVQYKEMWSEESIHSAYQSSGKDWEKTLDILTQ